MTDTAPTFSISETPTTNKRRGRPPGSTNKPKGAVTKADVDAAMSTLESGYNLITTGLVMFGFTDTATAWAESAAELSKTNRDALTASPRIVKAIISTGETGGSVTFFLTHGMAVAGLVKSFNGELAARRAERAANEPQPEAPAYDPRQDDPSYIPGLPTG